MGEKRKLFWWGSASLTLQRTSGNREREEKHH